MRSCCLQLQDTWMLRGWGPTPPGPWRRAGWIAGRKALLSSFYKAVNLKIWDCCSVAQSCPTLCKPMDCSSAARLPCPSLSPGVCSDSCPLSWWCHPTISSSAACFSSCDDSLGIFYRRSAKYLSHTWKSLNKGTSGWLSMGVNQSSFPHLILKCLAQPESPSC